MKPDVYNEQYIVKIFYQKADGFWAYKDLDVLVPILKNMEEKCNHDKAEALALIDYPNAQIISVIYC